MSLRASRLWHAAGPPRSHRPARSRCVLTLFHGPWRQLSQAGADAPGRSRPAGPAGSVRPPPPGPLLRTRWKPASRFRRGTAAGCVLGPALARYALICRDIEGSGAFHDPAGQLGGLRAALVAVPARLRRVQPVAHELLVEGRLGTARPPLPEIGR